MILCKPEQNLQIPAKSCSMGSIPSAVQACTRATCTCIIDYTNCNYFDSYWIGKYLELVDMDIIIPIHTFRRMNADCNVRQLAI